MRRMKALRIRLETERDARPRRELQRLEQQYRLEKMRVISKEMEVERKLIGDTARQLQEEISPLRDPFSSYLLMDDDRILTPLTPVGSPWPECDSPERKSQQDRESKEEPIGADENLAAEEENAEFKRVGAAEPEAKDGKRVRRSASDRRKIEQLELAQLKQGTEVWASSNGIVHAEGCKTRMRGSCEKMGVEKAIAKKYRLPKVHGGCCRAEFLKFI